MKTEPIAIFNPRNIEPDKYLNELDKAAQEVIEEVARAKDLFPSMFINQHEGIAVIREEYLELEQEVFKNQKVYDLKNQRKEAIQLAAMCARFATELIPR